jgi:hypothetical protein
VVLRPLFLPVLRAGAPAEFSDPELHDLPDELQRDRLTDRKLQGAFPVRYFQLQIEVPVYAALYS